MFRTTRHRQQTIAFVGFLMISIGLFTGMPMQASGQGSLTLTLDRNVGIGFGSIIQGLFTLRGSGPAEVQNLTVYFNGVQVHFVTGNNINWQFHTGDYGAGSTNISLFGLDNTGGTYSATTDVFFLSEALGSAVLGGVMILVVILIIVKYGPILRKKRAGSTS
ncbi:MAG: hypothetical protein ACXADC_01620 [Candidatus Thorarchaeota archaeon]